MNIELGSIEHNKRIIIKALEGIKDEFKIRDVCFGSLSPTNNILIRAIDRIAKINKVITTVRLCPLKKTQQRLCTGQCSNCKKDTVNVNNNHQ